MRATRFVLFRRAAKFIVGGEQCIIPLADFAHAITKRGDAFGETLQRGAVIFQLFPVCIEGVMMIAAGGIERDVHDGRRQAGGGELHRCH